MPMTFTDERLLADGKYWIGEKKEEETLEEYRERCAVYLDDRKDFMAAWEMRTGRPWNEMTGFEAIKLVTDHPELMYNPGFLSVLVGRQ